MPYLRKGSSVYQIRVKGRRQSADTTDFAAAKALEDKLNAEKWTEEKMGVKPAKTWAQLKAQWKHEREHKASWSDDERIMAWWSQYFSDAKDIRTIDRATVDTLILAHRHGVKPRVPCSENSTANHYVNILSAMLNAACREWSWTESSPKLRRYPQPEGRDRWLTVEEWQRLYAELPQHLQWCACFALATGLRAEKVFELEWSQVDTKGRKLTFKGTENKLGNTIPLNGTAMGVLENIRAQPARHMTRVFFWLKPKKEADRLTYTIEPLSSYGLAWWKAQERAGLGQFVDNPQDCSRQVWEGDVVWHTLRHTFTSWLGQSGVPDGIIDRLGGWSGGAKSGKTRERYTHLNVEHLRPYAAVIDRTLAGEQVNLMVMSGR
jgi:integrase